MDLFGPLASNAYFCPGIILPYGRGLAQPRLASYSVLVYLLPSSEVQLHYSKSRSMYRTPALITDTTLHDVV
jgi:hypothetical protein